MNRKRLDITECNIGLLSAHTDKFEDAKKMCDRETIVHPILKSQVVVQVAHAYKSKMQVIKPKRTADSDL